MPDQPEIVVEAGAVQRQEVPKRPRLYGYSFFDGTRWEFRYRTFTTEGDRRTDIARFCESNEPLSPFTIPGESDPPADAGLAEAIEVVIGELGRMSASGMSGYCDGLAYAAVRFRAVLAYRAKPQSGGGG